jgi:hypothetical protein
LLFGCIVLTIYKCCKNCCGGQNYNIQKAERRHGKKYEDDGWRYMSFPEDNRDIFEMRQLPTPRRNTGTKVMLLDETGNIPNYSLRSRSKDGTVKYTTYYNHKLGCMETEI